MASTAYLLTDQGWESPFGIVFFLLAGLVFVLSVKHFLFIAAKYVLRPLPWRRQTEPSWFGWKEGLSLAVAVVITILIFVFQGALNRLDELGYVGAFLAMLVGSATLVLPTSGIVVVFLLGNVLPNPLLLGILAGLGSAVGELTGYLAGYSGHGAIARTKTYQKLEKRVRENSFRTIFILALIPNPVFDIAGIAAGALRVPWWHFLSTATLGKVIKMIAIAYAGHYSVGWVERLIR